MDTQMSSSLAAAAAAPFRPLPFGHAAAWDSLRAGLAHWRHAAAGRISYEIPSRESGTKIPLHENLYRVSTSAGGREGMCMQCLVETFRCANPEHLTNAYTLRPRPRARPPQQPRRAPPCG